MGMARSASTRFGVILMGAGLAIGTLVGHLAFRTSPPVHRASAILLIPQDGKLRVEAAVPVIGNPLDRLRSIERLIVARPRLETIAEKFNLYERERIENGTEAVLRRTREAIHIDYARPPAVGRYYNFFSVSFDSRDKRTAVLAAEHLVTLFMRDNIEDRGGYGHLGGPVFVKLEFLVLDGARLHTEPVSPSRSSYLALGALAGATLASLFLVPLRQT
jgi:hypothetical protein